jgi:hypothetical protein
LTEGVAGLWEPGHPAAESWAQLVDISDDWLRALKTDFPRGINCASAQRHAQGQRPFLDSQTGFLSMDGGRYHFVDPITQQVLTGERRVDLEAEQMRLTYSVRWPESTTLEPPSRPDSPTDPPAE